MTVVVVATGWLQIGDFLGCVIMSDERLDFTREVLG